MLRRNYRNYECRIFDIFDFIIVLEAVEVKIE